MEMTKIPTQWCHLNAQMSLIEQYRKKTLKKRERERERDLIIAAVVGLKYMYDTKHLTINQFLSHLLFENQGVNFKQIV